jgi:hypothetical protein
MHERRSRKDAPSDLQGSTTMWTDARTLKISDIGLSENASHAFHSMLKIVQGRSIAFWQPSDIEHADVLLAQAGGQAAVIDAWGQTGKPLVLLTDDRDTKHDNHFALSYPFRVMQLLSMLDNVADHLRDYPTSATEHTTSPWTCAMSLRQLATPPLDDVWHVAHSADYCCVWISHGYAYASAEAFARLRCGELVLGNFSLSTISAPSTCVSHAVSDLAWFVGLSGAHDLAPWLGHDTPYRLHLWPDFGRLGAPMHMVELAAHASACARTPLALLQHSGFPQADVYRFLAAAAMAGWLSADTDAQDEEKNTLVSVPLRSGWTRLMEHLRRRAAWIWIWPRPETPKSFAPR